MRVALCPDGSRGDLHPMLALGCAFRDQGHEVVLCAGPHAREDAALFGFEFRPAGLDVRAFMQAGAASMQGSALSMLRLSARYFQEGMKRQFAEMPEATGDADLILGAGVQLAAGSAAEYHGVPYRYLVYCPVLIPSAEHAPMAVPHRRRPAFVNRVGWGVFNAISRLALGWPMGKERARLGLPRVRDVVSHLISPHTIGAWDPELAAVPADAATPITSIGYLHPRHPGGLPTKLVDFLSSGEPPVYIGFGSMPDPDPARTTRILLDAIEAVGCRALLSRGWAGLGEGGLPEHVQVVDSVPHSALFPRVRGVVHHGGAGTTATAARAGVPQLVVPHAVDQFYWGVKVHEAGIGPPPLSKALLSGSRFVSLLGELASNEFLASRARLLGGRLRQRDPLDNAAARVLATL